MVGFVGAGSFVCVLGDGMLKGFSGGQLEAGFLVVGIMEGLGLLQGSMIVRGCFMYVGCAKSVGWWVEREDGRMCRFRE